MKLFLVLCIFAVALSGYLAEARIFDRCGLVAELRRQGFPEDKMRDWVCLVEAESSRDTSKVGKVNRNGSRDYGLFQINDKYWCTASGPAGKDCNVKCSDVTTDDITKASVCAKKIFKRHGFVVGWAGYKAKCQGPLPDISNC